MHKTAFDGKEFTDPKAHEYYGVLLACYHASFDTVEAADHDWMGGKQLAYATALNLMTDSFDWKVQLNGNDE